jgi:hypothetical protein
MRRLICRLFHGQPMHPVAGVYRCRRCLRTWPVPWERRDWRPKADAPATALHRAES